MSQYEQIGVERNTGGPIYEGARQSPAGGHSPMHGHHLPQQAPHKVKELEEARQRIAQMEKTMRSVFLEGTKHMKHADRISPIGMNKQRLLIGFERENSARGCRRRSLTL